MKKISLFVIPLICCLAFQACKEENSLINLDSADQLVLDSTYTSTPIPTPQAKNVLLEDFTGVHCDNCPNAQHEALKIINSDPDRVVVVAVHSSDFSIPGVGGFPDFRTTHGNDLYVAMGNPGSEPWGAIDRKVLGSTNQILEGYAQWSALISSEQETTPGVNLNVISKSFDPSTGTLSMKVAATFTQSYSVPYYMSVDITETGIKGKQQTGDDKTYPPTGVNDSFTFAHVLRKMMSPWNGFKIASAPQAGQTYRVRFSTVLPSNWVADSCKVVSFVHQWADPGKKNVEQVLETTVK